MKFEFNGHSCVTRIVNSLLMSSNTSRKVFFVLSTGKKKEERENYYPTGFNT